MIELLFGCLIILLGLSILSDFRSLMWNTISNSYFHYTKLPTRIFPTIKLLWRGRIYTFRFHITIEQTDLLN